MPLRSVLGPSPARSPSLLPIDVGSREGERAANPVDRMTVPSLVQGRRGRGKSYANVKFVLNEFNTCNGKRV